MPTMDRRSAFRPSLAEGAFDVRFPRAVAGEDYERYSRAVWRQAQRWIARAWPRFGGQADSADDARDALRSVAALDLSRRLYPQEERLLGELVQHAWVTEARMRGIVPEIPKFLTAGAR